MKKYIDLLFMISVHGRENIQGERCIMADDSAWGEAMMHSVIIKGKSAGKFWNVKKKEIWKG